MRPGWVVAVFIGLQVAVVLVGLVLQWMYGGCFAFAWQMFACA